jgi:chromosome segregation protein
LLELLLHQSAGTLIIDQPEDDLDNRIIMRIVALIRTSKNHRQLIFATHNPNIVVNGDADKVIALRSGDPAIQLFTDGAIETADVRSWERAPSSARVDLV